MHHMCAWCLQSTDVLSHLSDPLPISTFKTPWLSENFVMGPGY